MANLIDLSLDQITAALSKGEVSSRELTSAYLDHIDTIEHQINAFITLTPELALQQAEKADRELSNKRKQGLSVDNLFLGVPIAIKDLLVTEGIRTTAGSLILETFIPPYNSTVVKRLLEAGIVILGKTNTDEFAMGSSTENSAFKTSRNPWNTNRVPGGSSGGSAAAVAARMTPVALGTDTGGSVRQPASFCGITGLKPTYGRVSRYGLIAFGSSLDSVGVLAKSAKDIVSIYHLIAGHDPLDSTSSTCDLPKIELETLDTYEGLRIGIPKEYFIDGIQPDIHYKINQTIDHFADLGAEIVEISLPHTSFAIPVYYLIAPAEASANLARYDGVRYGPRGKSDDIWEMFQKTRGTFFGQEVKRRIMIGTYALSAGYYDAYYGKAQKVRYLIKQDFDVAFKKVDIIAAPVNPTTAFKIGAHHGDPLSMYLEDIFTTPTNLAGLPGLAFPIGFDSENLPIGMQIIAPHFREDLLLKVVNTYQHNSEWHLKKPALIKK